MGPAPGEGRKAAARNLESSVMPALLLALLVLLAPGLAGQAPSSQAAPGPLARIGPQGAFRGLEDGAFGSSTGTTLWESLYDGRWIRVRYRSMLAGQVLMDSILMLRSHPDGEVRGWHLDDHGAARQWRGRVSERGMVLKQFDPEGRLLAMQVYQWGDFGYEFQLFTRNEEGELIPFLGSRCHPLRGDPLLDTTAAALERARELPYARYLGSFAGTERSPFGETTARFRCVPVLDGAWFETTYTSWLDGTVSYAGAGYTRCEEDGRTLLLWFDHRGDVARLEGHVDTEAAEAVRRNEDGAVIERHRDMVTGDGYEYRIELREGEDGPWLPYLEARYRRTGD